MGRKKANDTSDIKDSRITFYMTKKLFDDVSDLARLNRKSLTSYVNDLVENDVQSNLERIEKFRE